MKKLWKKVNKRRGRQNMLVILAAAMLMSELGMTAYAEEISMPEVEECETVNETEENIEVDTSQDKEDGEKLIENQTEDSEDNSEENTTEGLTEDTTKSLSEKVAEDNPPMMHQSLTQTRNGVTVTVTGNMPAGTTLHMETVELTSEEKERITTLSEASREAAVYSFDISLSYEDREYEPYLFDEKMQMTFSMTPKNRAQNVLEVEVFHIDEEADVEKLADTSDFTGKITFETVAFSKYVIIADANYEGITEWNYSYNGGSQGFKAPVKGVYKFELYGAQGSSYQEHTGGKGGAVTVYLELEKNEEAQLIIGGQNGFNGGGNGTVSNGGGATRLMVKGELCAIAGGGGGATNLADGGNGGRTEGASQSSHEGESSLQTYSAGGGGGYQGGMSGYTLYHKHTGSKKGGGCYTSAVRHVHNSSCERVCGTYQNFGVSSSNSDYIDANCSNCGAWACRPGDKNSDFVHDGSWKHTVQDCGKSTSTVEYYALGCGKNELTIDENRMSYGGSSYYNASLCGDAVMAAGVQTGNGKVNVKLTELDGATLFYYNHDMSLLGSITVEKGAVASYPLKNTPVQATDSKYTYEFAGWDDMATMTGEKYNISQTVEKGVTADRSYMAVYEKIPRQYTVTLDNAGAAVTGTQKITASYGLALPQITIPKKEGYLFAGYYSEKDGAGIQYYAPGGTSARDSEFTQDTTLYAYWICPISITAQPQDIILRKGYHGAVMETDWLINPTEGYQVTCQWYVSKDGTIANAEKINHATAKRLNIPRNYRIGDYDLFCGLTVTSSYNAQSMVIYTDMAHFTVLKGIFDQDDIICSTPTITYDGQEHAVKAQVNTAEPVKIYYSNTPLNRNNYITQGKTEPFSFISAGKYEVYVYVVCDEYEDYMGSITMTIQKAKWEITDANYPIINRNGTVSFPGGEDWEYDSEKEEPQYHHYQGEKLAVGDYLFRIEEDENHNASDSVTLHIVRNHAEDTGDNHGNGNNHDDAENNNNGSTGNEGTGNSTGGNKGNGGTGNSTGGNKGNGGTGNSTGDNKGNGGTGNSTGGNTGNGNTGSNAGAGIGNQSTKHKSDNSFGITKYKNDKNVGKDNKQENLSKTILEEEYKYWNGDNLGDSFSKKEQDIGQKKKIIPDEAPLLNDTSDEDSSAYKKLKMTNMSFLIGIGLLLLILILLLLFLLRCRREDSREEESNYCSKR